MTMPVPPKIRFIRPCHIINGRNRFMVACSFFRWGVTREMVCCSMTWAGRKASAVRAAKKCVYRIAAVQGSLPRRFPTPPSPNLNRTHIHLLLLRLHSDVMRITRGYKFNGNNSGIPSQHPTLKKLGCSRPVHKWQKARRDEAGGEGETHRERESWIEICRSSGEKMHPRRAARSHHVGPSVLSPPRPGPEPS